MSVFNAYMSSSGAIDADVIRQASGSRNPARRTALAAQPRSFVCANTYEAPLKTVEVLLCARSACPVSWGGGSNILAADTGYDGRVITLGREFSRMSFADDGRVRLAPRHSSPSSSPSP